MKDKFFAGIVKIFIVSLIAIIFATPSFADVESNDTKDDAETFEVNSTIVGHIGLKSDNGATDFYDYYKVVLPSDGKLDVEVDTEANLDLLSLNYINSRGYLNSFYYSGSDSDGSDGYHVWVENLGAGTYYIKLDYGTNKAGGYTLTNTFTPVSQANDSSGNDTWQSAQEISINTSTEGHIGFISDNGATDSYDYYKVVLPSDGKLDVEVDTEANLDLLSLNYINSRGYLNSFYYSGSDSDGSDGYHVWGENLGAGTYYIKLDYGANKAGGYTLTNTFTPVSQANDISNNDTWQNAREISINSSIEGHIGFISDNGATDFYDYYKVVLPSDGKLDVEVDTEANLDLLSLNYINSRGYLTSFYYSGSDNDGSDGYHVWGENLDAGTYYIKLDYGANKAGGYTLTNTFTSNTSDIPVTSITLNKSSVEMEIGDTEALTATVHPDNATDKTITWNSNDTSVATVNADGVVTAVAPGSAAITATSSNPDVFATCMIHVAVDDPNTGKYEEWTNSAGEPVAADKKWTVSFNKAVNQSFVNKEYFYVKDAGGNKVTDKVQSANGDFSKIEILSPAGDGYTPGMTYTLYIEGDISAEDGSELSKGIKMQFTIEEGSPVSGQAILTHRGFDFSEGEFRSDDDAWDAEFDNRKDGAIIFWEPVEAGDEGRGQYVWIESPDEESHENIVADMGAVSFESVTSTSAAVFEYLSPALVPGHVYIVKTLEGGFAKIQVLSTNPNEMTAGVKWSYSSSGEF